MLAMLVLAVTMNLGDHQGSAPIEEWSCAEWSVVSPLVDPTVRQKHFENRADPRPIDQAITGVYFLRGYVAGATEAVEDLLGIRIGAVSIQAVLARVEALCRERPYDSFRDATRKATVELVKARAGPR